MEAQNTLPSNGVTVFVDHRENVSNVSRYLESLGSRVISQQLKVGDYIASDRIGIERKRVQDFLGSITDQRIFRQVEELSNTFETPLIILEGNPELLYIERRIHPNVIRGVLASIAIDYKVPILYTHNPKETAAQIYWIAYREQVKEKRNLQIRACRKCLTDSEQLEFLVSGLPNINSKLSKRLLREFGTVKEIFSAEPEDLMKVDGIGKKKAKEIWRLLNLRYSEE